MASCRGSCEGREDGSHGRGGSKERGGRRGDVLALFEGLLIGEGGLWCGWVGVMEEQGQATAVECVLPVVAIDL